MRPFPLYRLGYALRYFLVKRIIKKCGRNVIVKNNCYFGSGERLSVGNNSQLGQNSTLNGTIEIGDDVLMGPEVMIIATSHEYRRIDVPIINQGEAEERKIIIGNDVWIGARAIILPGVEIGSHSIVGAGAVITKSFPEYSKIVGNPGKNLGRAR